MEPVTPAKMLMTMNSFINEKSTCVVSVNCTVQNKVLLAQLHCGAEFVPHACIFKNVVSLEADNLTVHLSDQHTVTCIHDSSSSSMTTFSYCIGEIKYIIYILLCICSGVILHLCLSGPDALTLIITLILNSVTAIGLFIGLFVWILKIVIDYFKDRRRAQQFTGSIERTPMLRFKDDDDLI